MKRAVRAMIVLAGVLFLLGIMAGCGKNEEEQIEALVEKLDKAKTEKEEQRIEKQIEGLEAKQVKPGKQINIKMGQPFTVSNWPSDNKRLMTRFTITFEDFDKIKEILFGGKSRILTYSFKNLGPYAERATPTFRNVTLKTSKGRIYETMLGMMYWDYTETVRDISGWPKSIFHFHVGAGETGKRGLCFPVNLDGDPIEVEGEVGGGETYLGSPTGTTKFCLMLSERLKIRRLKSGEKEEERIGRARADIRSLQIALEAHYVDFARYPKSLQALVEGGQALVEGGTRRFSYITSIPKDPWGHEFHYRSPGKHFKNYDLWSDGLDGQSGTEDDITNWSK